MTRLQVNLHPIFYNDIYLLDYTLDDCSDTETSEWNSYNTSETRDISLSDLVQKNKIKLPVLTWSNPPLYKYKSMN